jgi:hypothetical protein
VLNYTVSGADANTSHDLYQTSDGKFIITLWRSLADPGGAAIPVVVTAQGHKLDEYNLMAHLDNTEYKPAQSAQDTLTSQLDGGVRIIVVT